MATGALSRIANIIRADVDDLLSRMEDPDKMVGLMMADMADAVNEAVAAVADALASQRLLERRVKVRREESEIWDRKAERAVSRGDDDLARLALERKAAMEAETESLEGALTEAAKVAGHLKQQAARLKSRFQEARSRKGTLVSRRRASGSYVSNAPSPVRIREEAFERFDTFCQRVDREEAAAEIYEELAASDTDLDDRYEEIAQKERIDTQLREMKQKLADAKSEQDRKSP